MTKMVLIMTVLSFALCAPVETPAFAPVEYENAVTDTLIEPGKNPGGDVKPDTLIPEDRNMMHDSYEDKDSSMVKDESRSEITYAEAELNPTEGNNGSGRITFTKIENGIKITGEITGLTPGKHGIHIHEFGSCSDPEAESAGGHYNPDQMPHGAPEDIHRHTGDLGNLEADKNGIARIELMETKISFEGANSIIGKSIIIHSGEDDFKSQPAGNSGKRILCGIIQKSSKE